MVTPLVSIVIPSYNQSKFVGEAIQSAIDQTFRSYEIVVVDDGSTDNSREVIGRFGKQVRYIWQENRGLGGARNTGILASKGEFIGLLDADDLWSPNFLEKMVLLTEQHPTAAVYYCCAQSMDEYGHDLPQVFGGPVRSSDSLFHVLLRANFLIPSTILMRRSVVVNAGLFEQGNRSIHGCEDWDLWLRLLPEHEFVRTTERLVQYRLHSSSLSANLTGMQEASRAVIAKHFGTDDGQPQTWSPEKRLAYGGVYRYCALSTAQRQGDWEEAGIYLRKAFQADPTLSTDLDLFYDLAHGNQPVGFRGNSYQLDLETNGKLINKMLIAAFGSSKSSELDGLRRLTYGTANYALGLIAYTTGQLQLSRRFLFDALRYRPGLAIDFRVSGTLLKSLLGPSILGWLRDTYRLIGNHEYN